MAYTITNLIAITKKKTNIKNDLLPNIISSNSGISKDETSTHTITHKRYKQSIHKEIQILMKL